MQITRTDISPTEIKLSISAGLEELTPIKNEVVKRLGKDLKLPGFRPGKAPQAIIEKNIDQALLQNDFLDEAMTQLYAYATRKEKILPVTRPEVTVKKFVPFTQLEFEVLTQIVGKIKLPDISKINAKKEPVTVTSRDITEVINTLRTRLAEKKPVNRVAKSGDEAVIDFKAVDSSKEPVEGAEGKDYPLVLGSKAFIPGFEDNITGMKPDEEKTFDLTFPKDYNASELAGKKVTFTVKLKSVNELVEPKADDAFAAKAGPFKSVAELKDDIKKHLTDERERQAQEAFREEALRKISEKTAVDIPEALVEQQIIYNIDELRKSLVQRGQTYEEFLKSQNKTEEQYKDDIKPNAVTQLKVSLMLSEVAERDNITVEPDELKIHLQALKGQYNDPAMQAELDKPENQRDIASRLLSEKVVNHITSQLLKSV